MGLASALSTALTGITAAETQIDVIGNNLANSQTVGFKESRVVYSTQFLQTMSLGAAPSGDNGGTNPRQVGLGVQIAEISGNFGQGTIEISSNPSDLAIQGDGFFMVEGSSGEQLYSRNGIFKLNADAELVNSTGQRLLGFGVDELFRVQQSEVVPLTVPLGSKTIAKATEFVTLEGSLTPQGELSDTSGVIESQILGDANVPSPTAAGVRMMTAPVATSSNVSLTTNGNGSLAAGTYQYRFALVDGAGNESMLSNPLSTTVGPGNRVELSSLPVDPDGRDYPQVNIYRTDADGNQAYFLGTAAAGGSFTDDGTIGINLDRPANRTNLTGNYSYMITYHRDGEAESRPSEIIGPRNVVDGRLMLDGFPVPPTPSEIDGFPEYDSIRIYRNLAGDQNNFFLVDTVRPGETFTDSRTDAEISDLTLPGNQVLNRNGPPINSSTLLTNVLRRDGATYDNLFREGTLTYQGRKGGRALGRKSLEITETTTVQHLIDFMSAASGIQTTQVDSQNPIPSSQNLMTGESGTLLPGGSINDGALRFVSNTGELNSLEVDLTAFRLRDRQGNISVPNLAFGTIQEARGQSAATDFIVYDTLGVPINVRVTATLERRNDEETVYRWYADSPGNESQEGQGIAVGTGLVSFDGNGNFVAATNNRVNINRVGVPSVSPLQFDLDFSAVSGLATRDASLAATRQDGSAPGVLNSFVVGEDGGIRGVFSNGITQDLGQVLLARFANPAGLEGRGTNLYAQGINTGLPVMGRPGENGLGAVIGGALEQSNTDIGRDLVNLVLASTQYRGNSRVITTTQQLLDELLNMRR